MSLRSSRCWRSGAVAVLATVGLPAAGAQARAGALPAAGRHARAAAGRTAKATDYTLCNPECGPFTIQLYKKLGTWGFEGFPEYGGTYTAAGKELELHYEDGQCGGCYVIREKGKKGSYAGSVYYPGGGFDEDWVLMKQ